MLMLNTRKRKVMYGYTGKDRIEKKGK